MRQNKNWSKKEEDLLRRNYDKISAIEIGKLLDRTPGAVRGRASLLGLTQHGRYNTKIRWKDEDILFLRENYYKLKASRIATKLGKKSQSIQSKARQIGLSKKPPIEIAKEIVQLLTHTSLSINEISRKTHVSPYRIRQLLKDSKVKRRKTGRIGWKQLPLLEGFHYKGNKVGKQRAQLLYAYKRTCWDCKRTFVSDRDLHVHHDFSDLPVKILVLCKKCHKKRHDVETSKE